MREVVRDCTTKEQFSSTTCTSPCTAGTRGVPLLLLSATLPPPGRTTVCFRTFLVRTMSASAGASSPLPVPVFHPSWEDISDFASYIARIERQCPAGSALVRPPAGWRPRKKCHLRRHRPHSDCAPDTAGDSWQPRRLSGRPCRKASPYRGRVPQGGRGVPEAHETAGVARRSRRRSAEAGNVG